MWPFKPKSKPLKIPPFRAPPEPEKPAEPMEVHELLDPTQTVIDRFKDLLKRRLK